jgi:hypothetical protein
MNALALRRTYNLFLNLAESLKIEIYDWNLRLEI